MTVPSLLNVPKRRMITRSTTTTPLPAAQQKRNVTERALLGEGFVVSMKLPAKMNSMVVPTTNEPYQQFGVRVDGGYLNFHVYDLDKCQCRGNRFWAMAQIFKKTMDDGTQFIYVDLRPTDALHLSHELKVYQDPSLAPEQQVEGVATFACIGNIKGVISFIPQQMNAVADV